MRPYLRMALATSLLGSACCALVETSASAAGVADAPNLARPFSVLDNLDQNAPETLTARLASAAQSLKAAGGDCSRRADAAQRQLDLVVAKPAFAVVMPLGAARAASLAYDIHAARAACAPETALKNSELRAARDAALRAVDLYRDGLDYGSMAVMQFDAAVADRQLGDRANAAARLQTALQMDRAYGFQKEGAENAALLQRWAADAPGPHRAAEPPPTVPSRSAALKFAWSAKAGDMTVAASYVTVVKDKIVHSQGVATRTFSLRDDRHDWILSFPTNVQRYDFGEWPEGEAQAEKLRTLLLADMQLKGPAIRVGGAGDFKAVVDPAKVSAQLAWEATQLIRDLGPKGQGGAPSTSKVGKAVTSGFAPSDIAAMAAQDYDFTTAAWIGATLEQGVWYDMTAPIREPGGAYSIDYDIHFAFTRLAPCTTASTTSSCVEIVVHATPNPAAVAELTHYLKSVLHLPQGQSVSYWSKTDMRIVTDPDNLLPYVSDVRRYWYSAIEGAENTEPVINSERLVSTFAYR